MDIERAIERLNPGQREAVLLTEGPLLVLAGAGSGKTRVITTRVAWLIHRGATPSSVMAVTFTNKAAREMKERVASMVPGGGGPVIATFHALCLTILRREIEPLGYRRDFAIYDTSEQQSLLKSLLADITFGDREFRVDQVMDRISRTKNRHAPETPRHGKGPDDLEIITGLVSPRYHEALMHLNALDFDDLLLMTLRLFREHPGVLEKYRDRLRYLMVDEYQDTNRVQYELIRTLAGERRNLCVVGDDDQSIYGWRGAHLGNILDFERDFPGTRVVRLEQNYRSTGNILSAANGVIRRNKKRMEKTLWTESGPGVRVGIFRSTDGEDEARWVADRIALMRLEQRIRYEDCAVLYRANLYSRPFEEALRKNRIPYSVIGGTSFFDHREIKDLAAYLKVMANPRDDMSLTRIANIPKRGLGPAAVGKLLAFARDRGVSLLEGFGRAGEVADLGDGARRSAMGLAELMVRYRARFGSSGDMGDALRDLIAEITYHDHVRELNRNPDAALRRIEGCDAFVASIENYQKANDGPSLRGFLETLALDDYGHETGEKGGGVTLISFHSAKGLEFPVVFIVGAEEDIIPHKKSGGEIEEERRLFYVGMTRAMNELYITYTGQRTRYGKTVPSTPSRFIDDLPKDSYERLSRYSDDSSCDPAKDAAAFLANIRQILNK